MEIVNSLHHFLTHLSTPLKVCLILSVIAWFVALVLVCYLQDNPETGWHSLFDRLIAGIFPFGVMMLYLGTCMSPIIVSLLAMTFYVLFFLAVAATPSPFSGKR